ncbi:MAG: nitroreductase family protein [Lachnospiraceae bacterium]|jgi:uncharacterized protein|nr:nitroreductase family protein [Lachnospiraceae bacterium]
MKIQESLQNRRTYYSIDSTLPVEEKQVEELVSSLTKLVPDAFNMKSARAAAVFGDAHRKLWDGIYEAFGGKVAREKIDSFRAGAGTILYFYDQDTVQSMQEKFPAYAGNFPIWAQQANGMLQISIWSGLRELGIGASLQHYNPVIDETVSRLFSLPAGWKLIAQMPFGGIVSEPQAKEKEDISKRVLIFR